MLLLFEILTYLVAWVQAEEINELMKMRNNTNENYFDILQCEPLYISVATTRIDIQKSVYVSQKCTKHQNKADCSLLHKMPALWRKWVAAGHEERTLYKSLNTSMLVRRWRFPKFLFGLLMIENVWKNHKQSKERVNPTKVFKKLDFFFAFRLRLVMLASLFCGTTRVSAPFVY